MKDSYISFDPISERVCVLKLQGNSIKKSQILIIQVYLPTTDHKDEEVEEIYDQIFRVIENTSKRDYLIVQGDFNAKINGLKTLHPD